MDIRETFKSAFKALFSNKVRSILTMLGVIIGVFAVVALVAVGKGVENYITDQFEALGSNLLFVSPGQSDFTQDPATSFSRNKLNEEHTELIKTYAADYVENVTPFLQIGDTMKYKTNEHYTTVSGGNSDTFPILNYEIKEGREFTESEVRSGSEVVILGPVVKEELFGNSKPIGQSVSIGEDKYEVIGIFKEKSREFDDAVLVPHTAAISTFDIENYSSIAVKIKNKDEITLASKQIELALLRDLKEDDFTVLSQEEVLGSIQEILQIITLGIGAIAAISLLVGGIGIMNIMLVSVTERTREIGLRKAVGAKPKDIATQFLVESVLISVTGGTIGLLLGWGASFIPRQFVRTEVPLWAVVVAFGFSLIVGVVFGTYPAAKASKLDPIDALRYE